MLNMRLQSRGTLVAQFVSTGLIAAAAAAGSVGLADRIREFALRVRRAGVLFVAILSALMIFSVAVSPIPLLLWLIAIPLTGIASMLSLMWPSRFRPKMASSELPPLPQVSRTARAVLMKQRTSLFPEARDVVETMVAKLKAIEGSSKGSRLGSLADAEARRLLADHLPRLLDSYLQLPSTRRNSTEARKQLCESLGAVSGELESLSAMLDQRNADRFDSERRFFASKYIAADLQP